MINPEYFEKVFAYLHQELASDEVEAFERKLAEDPLLAEELKAQQQILQQPEGKSFETTLSHIHNTLQAPEVRFHSLKPQHEKAVEEVLAALQKEDVETQEVIHQEPVAPDAPGVVIQIPVWSLRLLKIAVLVVPVLIISLFYWLRETPPVAPSDAPQQAQKKKDSMLLLHMIKALPQYEPSYAYQEDLLESKEHQQDIKLTTESVDSLRWLDSPSGSTASQTCIYKLNESTRSMQQFDYSTAEQLLKEIISAKCNDQITQTAKINLAMTMKAQGKNDQVPKLLESIPDGKVKKENEPTIKLLLDEANKKN